METFAGIRPSDDMFTGGFSLRGWINDAYPHNLSTVIDARILGTANAMDKDVDCVSSIMKLGLDCSAHSPGERTNMKDALVTLKKIRDQFFKQVAKKVQIRTVS